MPTLPIKPATNPVTVLATFDAVEFLAENFGIVVTHVNMLPTFTPWFEWPTKWLMVRLWKPNKLADRLM